MAVTPSSAASSRNVVQKLSDRRTTVIQGLGSATAAPEDLRVGRGGRSVAFNDRVCPTRGP